MLQKAEMWIRKSIICATIFHLDKAHFGKYSKKWPNYATTFRLEVVCWGGTAIFNFGINSHNLLEKEIE